MENITLLYLCLFYGVINSFITSILRVYSSYYIIQSLAFEIVMHVPSELEFHVMPLCRKVVQFKDGTAKEETCICILNYT
jgi:hypothetical protein